MHSIWVPLATPLIENRLRSFLRRAKLTREETMCLLMEVEGIIFAKGALDETWEHIKSLLDSGGWSAPIETLKPEEPPLFDL